MPAVLTENVKLEYRTFGNPDHPTVLFIAGLGAQMTVWPRQTYEPLVSAGSHVVLFDNRDCGLSGKLSRLGKPNLLKTRLRQQGALTFQHYNLNNLVEDAFGLMDKLKLFRAHVVGSSMGGMIAQRMALQLPRRVITLATIMSAAGGQNLPAPPFRFFWQGIRAAFDRCEASRVQSQYRLLQLLGSTTHPEAKDILMRRAITT